MIDREHGVRFSSTVLVALVLGLTVGAVGPSSLTGQVPHEGEVRQLVTFTFQPGRSAEAVAIYRDQALPLYERDQAMLALRGFREVESPVPLDLVIVRGFQGMAGMDDSNEALRRIAAEAGTSIGALYGRIGALSTGHTDQFIEMVVGLGAGDPASRRLTAFVWYRVAPGETEGFETLVHGLAMFEDELGVPSSTGRFLVSDGWDYLRMLGFDSLGDYQGYWTALEGTPTHDEIVRRTVLRREVILSSVPALAIR